MSLDAFFARAAREGRLDIVDWSSNRGLGNRQGATNVFVAPKHGDRLPYLAQSMDYVLCVPSSAHRVAEAARVARFGVFEILLVARIPCVKPVVAAEMPRFDVLLLAAEGEAAVHTASVIRQDALGRARLFSCGDERGEMRRNAEARAVAGIDHLRDGDALRNAFGRVTYDGARTILLVVGDDLLLERGALAFLTELCLDHSAYVLVHKYGAPRLFAAADASTALLDVDFWTSPAHALRELCAACESRGFVRNAVLSDKLTQLVEI